MNTYTVTLIPSHGAQPIPCGEYTATDGQAAILQAELDYPGQPETARWWAICEYQEQERVK